MSKQYLIVLPIEPIPARETYLSDQSLPLHCTLMHWFGLSHGSLSTLDEGVEQLAMGSNFGDIELVSERAEHFGPNNDVQVHLLARNEHLNLLHTQAFKLLAETNTLFTELRWIGAGFRPHVTDTEWRHFPPGTRHHPTSLALIERNEVRDKFVTANYMLGRPPF